MSQPRHRRRKDRHSKLREAQIAAPPGSIITDPTAPDTRVRAFCYGPDSQQETEVEQVEDLRKILQSWPVTWVQVEGLGNAEMIRRIGTFFNLHPLALEDVVTSHQRPKVEEYQDHYYIVVREPGDGRRLETVQVNLFLGKGFLITFRSTEATGWEKVKEGIRQRMGRIRSLGPDYLAYTLIDATLDPYYEVLERLGDVVEGLEDQVIASPGPETMTKIHDIKHELLNVRRAVWPVREAINILLRDNIGLIMSETRMYLRDVHDHSLQIVDLVESFREIASGLMEVYLITLGNRTNEVMRVLTIIATLFIPLTFITGLYGMNFNPEASPWNMPELNWFLGYPFVLFLMAVTVSGLLFYFWRKGWLGSRLQPGTITSKERRRRAG